MDLQKNSVKIRVRENIFKNIIYKKGIKQIFIGITLFIIIYSFIASSLAPQKYNLKEGDIAPVDILSPKEIVNEPATNKLIEEAVKDVEGEYRLDESVKVNALKSVDDFFMVVSEIRGNSNIAAEAKPDELKSESELNLANDDYTSAITANAQELYTLKKEVENNLRTVFDQKIKNDENGLKSGKQDFSYAISNLKLRRELRDLGTNIGYALIRPNFILDEKATNEKSEAVKNKVTPVKIKKNQIIVKKNEVVTGEQIVILKDLGLLEDQKNVDFYLYLGVGIVIALLEGIVILYLFRFARPILDSSSKLILMSSIVIIELAIAKFATGYLIPVAFASMIVSILMKPRLALVLNIALSGLITLMTGYNIDTFIVAIIGGSAGAIIVSRMHQRNDLITAGLLISLINALSILGTGLISSNDIILVLKQSALGILNGALSSVFTIGLLPFCETTFGIVTPMKLLEMSNPNQPVLKRLLYEAPGTYHHSIIVGNLAEAAVDAIGGNSLLARVGSYYHDIGKLKRPYFFKENQLTSDNPHDKIAPSLSTLIITNHIKDGIDFAKKYKIPGIIKDMIEQHHGTTLVKYFYIKAVNGNEYHEEITENQYRYSGPKPVTRETAVVMLADSVEAAVRSISSPTRTKIEEMVNKIIKDKIEDKQLDDCDITLKDINKITESFLNVLSGIYHDRIEYPEMPSNEKGELNHDPDDR